MRFYTLMPDYNFCKKCKELWATRHPAAPIVALAVNGISGITIKWRPQ